ncbi:MAG: nitrilase-related carbon-nitrogen hydrolase [Planctomycetota bacterium]
MAEKDNPIDKTASPDELPGKAPPGITVRLAHLLYRTNWFRFILAGLSALGLILSFQPFNYGILAWLALVPLLVAILSAPNLKTVIGLGAVTGVIFYSLALHFFWPIFSVTVGLLLANILSFYLILFGASIWLIAKSFGLKRALILTPIFWTGLEYFRSECYFLKFSWLSLGYSQHNHLALIQICDTVGVYGLSGIIITVNALLTWFMMEKLRRQRFNLWSPLSALIIFGFLLFYGLTKLNYVESIPLKRDKHQVEVAVFQEEMGFDALERCIEKTNQTLRGEAPLVVIWPEVAIKNALSNSETRVRLETLAKNQKIYLIVGSEEEPERHTYQNLVIIFTPDGRMLGHYAKRFLVQFIETAFIKPGTQTGIFETDFGNIGILTCYEVGYTTLARETVQAGAKFLVVPTNEAKNWGRLEHELHASMVPYRAVETRRPLARSASVGISMVVDPYGRIQSSLDFLNSGVLRTSVTPRRYLTIYVRYGYLLPPLCLIIYILIMLGRFAYLLLKVLRGEKS